MHAIAYILDQFQQSSRDGWSAQVGAFFAWLNRFLIATWNDTEKERHLPERVVLPERPADGSWTDPLAEIPGEMRQVEWWQEGDAMVGLLRYTESLDDAILFSFYRIPCAALSLFRLATWYCEQQSPEHVQLQQPIAVLATALLPDGRARSRGSALVQIGSYQYVLQLFQPGNPEEGRFLLDGLPASFLLRQTQQTIPSDSFVNEHGALCFDDAVQAMSWFIEAMTLRIGGYLLPLSDLKGILASEPETRPAHSDLEKMHHYWAELEMDASVSALSEAERQERIAFLLQGVARNRSAVPLETLQALTEGIERILETARARRQAPASSPQEQS